MIEDKRLRIAHITTVVDGRHNSGTARVAMELITELSSFTNIEQHFIHYEEDKNSIYSLPRSAEVRIPLIRFKPARHFISFAKFWIINIFKFNRLNFDIVHWHASRVYPLFFLIPSKKVIITLHDANNRIIKKSNTFWTHVFYWNLRISKNKYDYIIGVSRDACQKLVTVGKFKPDKVKLMYLGSNFDKITPTLPNGFTLSERYFMCVSRWQPFKNVNSLIEAFAIAKSSNSEIPKLVLVGKPVAGYAEPLEKVRNLNLQNEILILQDLSDNELAYLYDHSLISFAPSLHEGFGLSVLESLKRGCPVVDHKFTSTSEISSNAGIHIDMNSVDDIAKTILEVSKNSELVNELRINARPRAAQFTWENSVTELLKLYQGGGDDKL